MDLTEIVGLIAGFCTASSLLPQVIKTYRQKSASEVSWLMFSVMLAGNMLWVWFGVGKQEVPIILTNCFALLLNAIMIFFKSKYHDASD